MQIVDIGADKYHASLLLEADVFFPGLFIHSLPPRALFRDLCLLLPSSERPRRRSDVTCATRKWTRRSTASSQREVGSVAPARPGLAAWSHAAGWQRVLGFGGFAGEAQGCCTAYLFQITAQHHLAVWGAHRSQPWAGRIAKQLMFSLL